ncbi:two-component sensor histidine kinase [Flavobacterium noncentrifugens]|uniref:histidine kinase n=1 Tax=Flavobacterium noncentrifugens TaxID=1128970 RepID=A0A1G8RAW0_9FLAO|nr:HAMP domain-containing sensor histidine kinase [Flavobacterium noncentrifugens]GEP49360.1 two-component sensor histidine kinase [Flavobacterium noncentrifugens]SDJ14088.1 Signal transduction histidine kinase [Flavobacterium noncentrifugens]
MTLKRKIAINISIAFSLLYGISALLIYISFSTFRKEEFQHRLEEKARTTTKLLFEVKEIDRNILKLIDQNTINKLYNEKTLVFDHNYKLIYSSIDDASIKWNLSDLKKLKSEKTIFRTDKEKDVFGIFYDFEGTADYYVLIAAEDKYGKTQLHFLLEILIISFFLGTALVWFSTYFFIRKQLEPLDDFEKRITKISANRLNTQLSETAKDDEINLLTKAFNQMLIRIENSFNAQKEFTSNASHELRTPITRLTLQLDNLIKQENHAPSTIAYLKSMENDLNQVTDLINSLLLLAKINRSEAESQLKKERIDEIVFEAFDKVKMTQPDFQMNFEILGNPDSDLEINGIKSLLEIVFANLFRNAYLYSDNKKANVTIEENENRQMVVTITNDGEKIIKDEQSKLFQPFVRGTNATQIHGSGLGLRIAKRILDYHQAKIDYSDANGLHQFCITFSI